MEEKRHNIMRNQDALSDMDGQHRSDDDETSDSSSYSSLSSSSEEEQEQEEAEEETIERRLPSGKELNALRYSTESFVKTVLKRDDKLAGANIDVDHAVDVRTDIVGSIEAVINSIKGLKILKRHGNGESLVCGMQKRHSPLPHGMKIHIDVGCAIPDGHAEAYVPYGRFSVKRLGKARNKNKTMTMHQIMYMRMTQPPSSSRRAAAADDGTDDAHDRVAKPLEEKGLSTMMIKSAISGQQKQQSSFPALCIMGAEASSSNSAVTDRRWPKHVQDPFVFGRRRMGPEGMHYGPRQVDKATVAPIADVGASSSDISEQGTTIAKPSMPPQQQTMTETDISAMSFKAPDTRFDEPPAQSRIVMAVIADQMRRWPRVSPVDSDILQTIVQLSHPECLVGDANSNGGGGGGGSSSRSSKLAPRGVWEHLIKTRCETVVLQTEGTLLPQQQSSVPTTIADDAAVARVLPLFVLERMSDDKKGGRVLLHDRVQGRDPRECIDAIMSLIVRCIGQEESQSLRAIPSKEVRRILVQRAGRYIGAFAVETFDEIADEDHDPADEIAMVYRILYTPLGARSTRDSYLRYMLNMKQHPYIVST